MIDVIIPEIDLLRLKDWCKVKIELLVWITTPTEEHLVITLVIITRMLPITITITITITLMGIDLDIPIDNQEINLYLTKPR